MQYIYIKETFFNIIYIEYVVVTILLFGSDNLELCVEEKKKA